jgi:hypothetical protein
VKLRPALVGFSTALGRRERITPARAAARAALQHAAAMAGAPPSFARTAPARDGDGAPLPRDGWHWSLADTTGLAAALVAPVPAALDAEWLGRPRWESARLSFHETGELARLGGDGKERVLALWCAKEALLKLRRVGLAELGDCLLVERRSPEVLLLRHRGRENVVRVFRHEEHVLALACDEPAELEPVLLPQALAEVRA